YYGFGIADAYLGDEDQGQMSAWFVMTALGLFQTDGGCSVEPVYEIAGPLFEKVEIDLGGRFGRGKVFTIEAEGVSRPCLYVQSAELNGRPLHSFKFPAGELLKGGRLKLKMGATPNKTWGTGK
ncbi:MAG: glycoside hydrolase family 92 protein, partial [Tannerella sp.]|nr:glycoside hydrolase family 92 protein [Tannerella sp.]